MLPILAQGIYSVGSFMRNSLISRRYSFLKQSENWSLKELEEYQLFELKKILSFAYEYSAFYKETFDANDFKIASVNSVSDIILIPTVSKNVILERSRDIQIMSVPGKMFFSETSGSTGTPLVFYRNKDWDAWHNASVQRGYSWHNVTMWERNGYLWGYNIDPQKHRKIMLQDMLQNRFRLFSYNKEEMRTFLFKLKQSSYLSGYSSMIYELAKLANEMDMDLSHLKMVKGTSEKIYDIYQVEAERAFGQRIVSEYGSAEAGIIAFECRCGKMHINMETVIVEEIDHEIVVTNLVSKSFPIIRYKLGDYIKINKNHNCKCGMPHYVIEEVTGRIGNVIRGHKNSYPSLTLYYVFKNIATNSNLILNYSSVQSKIGILDLYLERKISFLENKLIRSEFSKYFSDDLTVLIHENCERDIFDSKKKDFVSTLSGAGKH